MPRRSEAPGYPDWGPWRVTALEVVPEVESTHVVPPTSWMFSNLASCHRQRAGPRVAKVPAGASISALPDSVTVRSRDVTRAMCDTAGGLVPGGT